MQLRSLIAKTVAPGAATLLITAILRIGQWAIERATPKREGEHRLPAYYGAVGLMSGAMAGLCLGLGVLGRMTPARHDFLPWLALVAGFAAGGVYTVVGAANWRLWLDADGLQLRDEWGRTRPFAHWADLSSVRPGRGSMLFELRAGGRLKIPLGVAGLHKAVEAAHAAGVAVDAETLAEMRRGGF